MTDVMTPVEWLEQDYDRRAGDEDNWPQYTRTFMELIEDPHERVSVSMMRWRPCEGVTHLGPEYPTALAPASA